MIGQIIEVDGIPVQVPTGMTDGDSVKIGDLTYYSLFF